MILFFHPACFVRIVFLDSAQIFPHSVVMNVYTEHKLVELADQLSSLTGRAVATIGTKLQNDSRFFFRLKNGGGCTMAVGRRVGAALEAQIAEAIHHREIKARASETHNSNLPPFRNSRLSTHPGWPAQVKRVCSLARLTALPINQQQGKPMTVDITAEQHLKLRCLDLALAQRELGMTETRLDLAKKYYAWVSEGGVPSETAAQKGED